MCFSLLPIEKANMSTIVLLVSWFCFALAQESGDLRLTGYGSSSLSGRLEIYWDNQWGTICRDDRFDWKAATVACRQLGLGHPIAYLTSPELKYGLGSGPILLEEVVCHGNESHLLRCRHSGLVDGVGGAGSCLHEHDVAIACSNVRTPYTGQVRLTGSTYPSSGLLEIHLHHEWAPLCASGFDVEEAESACRQLGYTGVGTFSDESVSGPHWSVAASCSVAQPCLTSCLGEPPISMVTTCPDGSSAYTIHCSYSRALSTSRTYGSPSQCTLSTTPTEDGSVRLGDVSGSGDDYGRVELYYEGEWGMVCDDNFRFQEGDVVCKQLGFSTALSITPDTDLDSGSTSLYVLSCSGIEDRVNDCSIASVPTPQDCHDIWIRCSDAVPPYGTLSLLGTAGPAGALVMFTGLYFEPLCDTRFDLNDAHVACTQLGYSGGAQRVVKNAYYGQKVYPDSQYRLFGLAPSCAGMESHLLLCPLGNTLGNGQCREGLDEVGIQCVSDEPEGFGDLRLVGGGGVVGGGRLEVNIGGQWGSVCGVEFDQLSAVVACRQLGFVAVEDFSPGSFGAGSGPIHLLSVHCWGFEDRLLDCPHSVAERGSSCQHSQDLGLECSAAVSIPHGSVRLVGGANNSEGRLEFSNYGVWMSVYGGLFTERDAAVACRGLGFDFATRHCTDACFGPGSGAILFPEWKCRGTETSLLDCQAEIHNSDGRDHSMTVGLVCGRDDAIRSTKMEVESTATRSPVPTSVSDQTPVSTKEPEPPTHFFLPIPEVAFYVGICAVAVVIVVLIVAVTLCCICTCGKRKTQWQPAVQPARTQVTNPSAIALRERERNDRGATITTRATLSPVESFELPSKSGADKMEAYDDPTETVETFCTESDSLPPPPKYEELEF